MELRGRATSLHFLLSNSQLRGNYIGRIRSEVSSEVIEYPPKNGGFALQFGCLLLLLVAY